MGNRAIVIFRGNGHESPRVYMHWGGAMVPRLLSIWWKSCQVATAGQGCAQFVGICHEQFKGTISIWNAPEKSDGYASESHGDAGVFVVDMATGVVERFDCGDDPENDPECPAPRTWKLGSSPPMTDHQESEVNV